VALTGALDQLEAALARLEPDARDDVEDTLVPVIKGFCRVVLDAHRR
jgi:hypothetical protein